MRANHDHDPASLSPAAIGDSYDVVVGARAAGAATALLLARAGLSVLAVDRGGYRTDTLSTHALTRSAVLQLSRWGVLDEIRASGTPCVGRVVYEYGQDVVEIAVRPDGDVDGLYAPRRTVLDSVLVDAAFASGADIAHRTALEGLIREPDGRVAGVIVERGGRRSHVRCSIVIGADGARSAVARHVGAPVEHTAGTGSATIYGYVPGLPTDVFRNVYRPGLVVGVIPTNDDEANVWVAMPAQRLARGRSAVAAQFDEALAAVDAGLARHARGTGVSGSLRIFPGRRGHVRRAWGRGWALVGDAVYFKDPVSAHGITDALVGAELLARAVIDIVDGGAENVALSAYAAERSRLTRRMMTPLAVISAYGWDTETVQGHQMAMSRAMRDEWTALKSLDDRFAAPSQAQMSYSATNSVTDSCSPRAMAASNVTVSSIGLTT